MKKGLAAFLLLTAGGVATGHATDLKAGQKAASMCSVCHGKNGLSVNPEAPNLAGDSTIYIERQLKAYRGGERQHPQMTIIAQQLSDDQIVNLAAWYAAMQVSVVVPKVD